MFKKKKLLIRIIIILAFIASFSMSAVLIIESLKPGQESAATSNKVGGEIAEVIEKTSSDKSVEVKPTQIEVKNLLESYEVGSQYQIEVSVLPEDASTKSVIYENKAPDILDIDSNGLVTFKQSGAGSVKVSVNGYQDIQYDISFNVIDVMATKIIFKIYDEDNKEIKAKKGIYELNVGASYHISTSLEPENAKEEEINYQIVGYTDYNLESDILTPLIATDKVFKIKYATSHLEGEVSISVKALEEDISLEGIELLPEYQDIFDVDLQENINIKDLIKVTPYNANLDELELEVLEGSEFIDVIGDNIYTKQCGNVKLKISSNKNENIHLELSFNILYHQLTSFDISIPENLIVGKNEYLHLTNFTSSDDNIPSIAYQNVLDYTEFSVLDEEILLVNNKGLMEFKQEGNTTIKVIINDNGNLVEKSIEVSVTYLALDHFETILKKDTINVGEKVSITNKNFYTSDNKQSSFSYLSSSKQKTFISYQILDEDILEYQNGYLIGKKEGSTKVIVNVSDNGHIVSNEIDVSVCFNPLISVNSTASSNTILLGKTVTIKNNKYLSNDNVVASLYYRSDLADLVTYESSDENILKVSKKGVVSSLSEGSAYITIKFYENKELKDSGTYALSNVLYFNVIKENMVADFNVSYDIDYSLDHLILYTNESINFSSLFKLDTLVDKNNVVLYQDGQNQNGYLEEVNANLQLSCYDNDGNLYPNTCVFASPIELNLEIYQENAKFSKYYQIYVIDRLDINLNVDKYLQKEKLNNDNHYALDYLYYLFAGIDVTLDINSNNYHYDIVQGDILIEENNNQLRLSKDKAGLVTIKITPTIDDILLDDYYQLVTLQYVSPLITDFSVDVYLNNNGYQNIDYIDKVVGSCFSEFYFEITSLVNNNTTKKYQIVANNNVSISGMKVRFLKPGEYKITIIELYTNIQKEINFVIGDYIKLKDKPITVIQDGSSIKLKNNKYEVIIFRNAKLIVNFDTKSTYKKVIYTSSDSSILSIGSDGYMTPKRLGNVKIKVSVLNSKDEIVEEQEFNFEVVKVPVIKDLNNFMYKIRKLIGHFSAFLILAIFTSLGFLLWLDYKKWIISLPVSLFYGFFMGCLTEFFQSLVPNRGPSWADVWLDFRGYLLGYGIVVFILGIIYLIVYLVKRRKKKE